MADLITDTFRKYQETGKGKWPGKAITLSKSKTDYSSVRGTHPDDAVNQEYIDQKGSMDLDRPLCFAVHSPGKPCRRVIRRGTDYCWKGRGDE